jgi:hypothetical protein
MPTPATRTPVRIARGTYANLNTSILDLAEGEICYATDQNKIYTIEGGALTEQAFLDSADIAVTVQGYDVDTAKTDIAQSFTAAQRGTVSALGTVSAGTTTLDLATANNFSLTLPAGGSVTLGNPSNQTAGQSGVITITQNGTTAATVPYGGNWKFQGGAPTVSTTLSSVNVIAYYVESASRITAQLLTNTVS